MPDPTLDERLRALARVTRANGSGLSVIGCAKLAQELEALAAEVRRLRDRTREAEADLVEYCGDRQGELTDGAVIVMPRRFPRDFTINLHGEPG